MRTSRAVIVAWPREVGLVGFMGVNPLPSGLLEAVGGSDGSPARWGDRWLSIQPSCMAIFVVTRVFAQYSLT